MYPNNIVGASPILDGQRQNSWLSKAQPNYLRPIIDAFPPALLAWHNWCLWSPEFREGKWTKVPYCSTSENKARSNSPVSWSGFNATSTAFNRRNQWDGAFGPKVTGFGFMVAKPFTGVDLDHCHDPKTGQIEPWAMTIVKALDSYTEVSASGTGLRIIIKGKKPIGAKCRVPIGEGQLEVYDTARFVTLTGHRIGHNTDVMDRQKALEDLCQQFLPPSPQSAVVAITPPAPDGTESKIIELAHALMGEEFAALWAGDASAFNNDRSRADMALVSKLAFFTGPNISLLDALFRLSGLYRDKWEDRADYRDNTINRALNRDTFYKWPTPANPNDDLVNEITQYDQPQKNHNQIETPTEEPIKSTTKETIDEMVQEARDKGCKPNTKAKNQAALLADLARKNIHSLWATDDGCYASVKINGHIENWPLPSDTFNNWVLSLYYQATGSIPAEKHVKAVAALLRHEASQGQKYSLEYRLAQHDGKIYWDLGNANWECVEVSKDGWRVIQNPPVRFSRTKNTGELPLPVSGGKMSELRPFINADDQNWLLIVGSLLDALKAHGPYFILTLSGEQGSAKSTATKLIKALVDPVRKADLSGLPKSPEALGLDCFCEYMLGFDNVSHLSHEMSDALCRISSGSGLKTRKLYTSTEQAIFGMCRPLVLNGIPDFAERQDLLSRSLILQLDSIADKDRLDEKTLWNRFYAIRPRLLGALLDLMVAGLNRVESIQLDDLPRMADSAKWCAACLGNRWYEAYCLRNAETISLALESSYFAMHLKTFMQGKRQWEGSASDLLRELRKLPIKDLSGRLPDSPRWTTTAIKREAGAMRKVWGLDCITHRTKTSRLITLKWLTGDGGDATAEEVTLTPSMIGDASSVTSDANNIA